jgi:hypothetical protein
MNIEHNGMPFALAIVVPIVRRMIFEAVKSNAGRQPYKFWKKGSHC